MAAKTFVISFSTHLKRLSIASGIIRFAALLLTITIFLADDSFAQTGQEFTQGNTLVKASLFFDVTSIQPSRNEETRAARIGIRFVIEPGWHIYWKNSGEAGFPTTVKFSLPEGWHVENLRFPTPYKFLEKGDIITNGYENELVVIGDLFTPILIPTDDAPVSISATAGWLVCKDICVPGEQTMQRDVLFGTLAPLQPSNRYALFERVEALTPQPLSFLSSVAELKPLNIKPVVSKDTVVVGQTYHAGVLLSGLSSKQLSSLQDSLQLFTDPSDAFEAERPLLKILGDESVGGDAVVTFPFRVQEGTPNGANSLSGILALSCALCDSRNDLTLQWEIPLIVAADEGSGAGLNWKNDFVPTPETGKELRFREKSHDSNSSGHLPNALPMTHAQLIWALLAAFAAGVFLNVMPCVLPVISLKVMTFLENGTCSRRAAIRNALLFSAGVLTTFLVLAISVVVLKDLGYQIGWGFQFQHLSFVFPLTLVVFILSLGFFEVYHIQLPGLQVAHRAAGRFEERAAARHFFDGILATLLSTPCTAPFLGTALGFAFTQSSTVTIAVFLAIGLGLATPYVLLSANSKLLSHIPKPGPWMEIFKQFLGFLLLGTVVWLLFVLQSLTPSSAIPTVALLLVIYFLLWMKGHTRRFSFFVMHPKLHSLTFWGLLFFVSFKTWTVIESGTTNSESRDSQSGIVWAPYSAELADSELARGRVVFIDFTADWCITCKFNERFVLAQQSVVTAFEKSGVTGLKGDWTTRDDAITAALTKYNGHGVPHYVVLSPKKGESPNVLPSVLTPGTVTEAIQAAKE